MWSRDEAAWPEARPPLWPPLIPNSSCSLLNGSSVVQILHLMGEREEARLPLVARSVSAEAESVKSYSAEGATERIKRQTLYNAAHETVLADQISTFGQRDRVKREQ